MEVDETLISEAIDFQRSDCNTTSTKIALAEGMVLVLNLFAHVCGITRKREAFQALKSQ
jgi:hypothetical protein